MSISSSLASTIFPLCNSSSSLTPKHPSAAHFTPALPTTRIQLQSNRSFRPFAVPEALEQLPEVEDGETATGIVGAESDKLAPKQKIRIKLRSYWVPLIEDSCKQIMDAARTTNAKTMGPVPLPTKKRIYCVLKSPHVHKDARFHFEIRTHQRLIDILHPTAQTIDSLMQLDLPAGVDVELAPKQKIRIKLRSYWVPLIEDSCKQIMDAARTTNAKTMGPVPLPTKKRIYCVLKSPHVHKDARFHFEIRTHQRLIDILHPTAQTIDSLMQLDLPAGVDVEVKL
ncbi:ribosomal protein S10 [Artemisia annua]|uniref:Small ribosomal subunit protein uS10c n=1 Tax=Artemisia annua TaxID=35608 RepID=A0A2U1MBA4_ARTAN|nr:ribosomal protein S10 [Artemisia annua]